MASASLNALAPSAASLRQPLLGDGPRDHGSSGGTFASGDPPWLAPALAPSRCQPLCADVLFSDDLSKAVLSCLDYRDVLAFAAVCRPAAATAATTSMWTGLLFRDFCASPTTPASPVHVPEGAGCGVSARAPSPAPPRTPLIGAQRLYKSRIVAREARIRDAYLRRAYVVVDARMRVRRGVAIRLVNCFGWRAPVAVMSAAVFFLPWLVYTTVDADVRWGAATPAVVLLPVAAALAALVASCAVVYCLWHCPTNDKPTSACYRMRDVLSSQPFDSCCGSIGNRKACAHFVAVALLLALAPAALVAKAGLAHTQQLEWLSWPVAFTPLWVAVLLLCGCPLLEYRFFAGDGRALWMVAMGVVALPILVTTLALASGLELWPAATVIARLKYLLVPTFVSYSLLFLAATAASFALFCIRALLALFEVFLCYHVSGSAFTSWWQVFTPLLVLAGLVALAGLVLACATPGASVGDHNQLPAAHPDVVATVQRVAAGMPRV